MSRNPDYGERLRQWLPAVWRERDESGDLTRVLRVYGELLDTFHATVVQRRDDSFPDQDTEGEHCQDWLLPYFARLLDVRLVSPDPAGRRAELRDAVAWRQRKGTRVSIESIAEAVGRFEVEIQEGWKRVAITPRVDRPLIPAAAYGENPLPTPSTPAMRAGHPGLPAVTLDLRRCSRAVQCAPGNPGAHETRFADTRLTWRQVHRHGVPCLPDSYQDVSRRTPDVRTPERGRGLHHPRRVLLHLPPPEGFFATGHATVNWSGVEAVFTQHLETDVSAWPEDRVDTVSLGPVLELTVRRILWKGTPRTRVSLRGLTPVPVRIRGIVEIDAPALVVFENLWLDNRVEIATGTVQLIGCAARQMVVTTVENNLPAVDARACLFKKLEAGPGLVRLEFVTVLETLFADRLEASDCILVPDLRKQAGSNDLPSAGCVRFSRLFHIPRPPDPNDPTLVNDLVWVSLGLRSGLRCHGVSCTTAEPLFWSDTFGEPGCAVLHPECAAAIASGAEDGGEMGASHEFRHVLRQRAVLDKLLEFLPVGMEAVLVPDTSLACPPPVPI